MRGKGRERGLLDVPWLPDLPDQINVCANYRDGVNFGAYG